MKQNLTILILLFFASCQKSATKITATYTLFDSNSLAINENNTLLIDQGNSVVYKGTTWTYNAGYYFNGLNYIYLYAPSNDSLFIAYPDTAITALSIYIRGYKQQ